MQTSTPSILAAIPGPGLIFGLMLVAAIVGGHAARFGHIPRVVGFLVGGIGLRAALSAAVASGEDDAARQALDSAASVLKPVKDLALGLILFTIGGVFERSRLQTTARRVFRIGICEIGLVFGFVVVVCAVLVVMLQPSTNRTEGFVLALLLGLAAIATAPAATLFVLHEYEAKGSVTDTILGLTALNNIVCIVLFQLAFLTLASTGVIRSTGALADHVGLAMVVSTLGSVVLGVIVGTIISLLHARLPLSEALLFFFALFIVLGAGENWLWRHEGVSYNFLLTALVIGGTFANLAIDARKLESALRTFATPIFAGFFVMAGYELHLGDFATMGWLGAGYILARLGGKWIGCHLGLRWAKAPARAEGRLGGALLCQAAVVIGLASFADRYWDSELAGQFSTILLGSVVVFELIGPLLVKRCAVQAGEVKAITLLRRTEPTEDGRSVVRRTLRSLGRMFGIGGRAEARGRGDIRVEHIMRTNVQLISASASFDEVLHEMERSTHSHFPVVHDDGEFAGVIHFSDVHDVIYDPSLSKLVTAVDLADADSVTVAADLPLTELLGLFNQHGVAVLPVVEQSERRRIVGLVEQRDLLRALHLSKDVR